MLGDADLASIVLDVTHLRAPPRFDVSTVLCEAAGLGSSANNSMFSPSTGEALDEAELRAWVDCWRSLNLSKLHGFPVWDAQLHHILHPHFGALQRLMNRATSEVPRTWDALFSPPVEVATAHMQMTMPQWTRLVKLMSLKGPGPELNPTPIFEMHCVSGGETLSLSGFVSALIQLSFAHGNPHYEADRAAGEVTARQRLRQVPDCISDLVSVRIPFALIMVELEWTRAELDVATLALQEKHKVAKLASSEVRGHTAQMKRQKLLVKGRAPKTSPTEGHCTEAEAELERLQAILERAQVEAEEVATVQSKKQKAVAQLQRESATLKLHETVDEQHQGHAKASAQCRPRDDTANASTVAIAG